MIDEENDQASLEGEEAIEKSIIDSANSEAEATEAEAEAEEKGDEAEEKEKEDSEGEAEEKELKAETKEEVNEIDLIKKEFATFKQQIVDKNKIIEGLQQEVTSFSKKYTEDRKKVLKEEKQEIIRQQKEAIDDDEWARLEEKREGIDKEIYSSPAAKKENQASMDPVLLAWGKNNKWFYEDKVLGSYAQSVDDQLATQSPYMSLEDRLDKVEAEVKDRFPEKFGIEPVKINNRKITAQGGQRVGISAGNTKIKKHFNELPSEAKKTFIGFCEPNGMTKEQYVESYYE